MKVAKSLCMTTHSEPEWRTAQGRAYYALYNHVTEEMSAINARLFKQDGQDHSRAASYLKGMPIADLQLVGVALENLKKARQDADYRMALAITHPVAQLTVDQADKEIARFDGVAKARLQGVVLATVPR